MYVAAANADLDASASDHVMYDRKDFSSLIEAYDGILLFSDFQNVSLSHNQHIHPIH